jgi:hypothetical protein
VMRDSSCSLQRKYRTLRENLRSMNDEGLVMLLDLVMESIGL